MLHFALLHFLLIPSSFAFTIFPSDSETQKSEENALDKRQSSSTPGSVLQYVDPFIGTSCGGHVMPGATLPFGMAKACADVVGDNQGGFAINSDNIYGFSHMHDSGTGGSPSLGNFPIWAQSACPGDDLNNCKWRVYDRNTTFVNETLKASPGYFAIGDVRGITTEMTVTEHTALYRITFPADPPEGPLGPIILVDLLDLPNSRINGSASVDAASGRMVGNGTFNPSFGIGTYDLHFCADVSGGPVRDNGIWVYDRAGTEPKDWHGKHSCLSAVSRYILTTYSGTGWCERRRSTSSSRRRVGTARERDG
jgi:phage tail protein X